MSAAFTTREDSSKKFFSEIPVLSQSKSFNLNVIIAAVSSFSPTLLLHMRSMVAGSISVTGTTVWTHLLPSFLMEGPLASVCACRRPQEVD